MKNIFIPQETMRESQKEHDAIIKFSGDNRIVGEYDREGNRYWYISHWEDSECVNRNPTDFLNIRLNQEDYTKALNGHSTEEDLSKWKEQYQPLGVLSKGKNIKQLLDHLMDLSLERLGKINHGK